MSAPTQLIQLTCVHCGTPLAADENEIAWQCPQCQNGTRLTETGLAPVPVHWAAARPGPAQLRWLPFWVFAARVQFRNRQSYRGDNRPDAMWAAPRRFYIPAFAMDIRQLESTGAALLRSQPNLARGTVSGKLAGCSLSPEEAVAAAEFVVITIEAGRQDMLKTIDFVLEIESPPELWLLPFEGERLRLA